MRTETAETCAEADLRPTHTPIRLANLEDVRREMASIYRDMRRGNMAASDGTKFAFVLAQLGKLIVESDIERRIEVLEEKHAIEGTFKKA